MEKGRHDDDDWISAIFKPWQLEFVKPSSSGKSRAMGMVGALMCE
jgi:hypothetical protein